MDILENIKTILPKRPFVGLSEHHSCHHFFGDCCCRRDITFTGSKVQRSWMCMIARDNFTSNTLQTLILPITLKMRLILTLAASLLIAFIANAQDYPSCIGLDLATNFYFSGDANSLESCQEACNTLFMVDIADVEFDTGPLTNGTLVDYCSCGSQGVLCQDAAAVSSGAESTTMQETTTTTAPPENSDTTEAPPTSTATRSATVMSMIVGAAVTLLATLVV